VTTGRAIYLSAGHVEATQGTARIAEGIILSSIDVSVPLDAVLDREYRRGVEEGRRLERDFAGGDAESPAEESEREARALISAIEGALKVLEHDRSVALGGRLERALEKGGQRVAARIRAEAYAALANVELNRSLRSSDQAEVTSAQLRARNFLGRARDATRS
jgi:hypothetical protein